MQCKKCFVRLLCYESRPSGDDERFRYYVCPHCGKRFISHEVLNWSPLEKKGMPNHLKKSIERGNKK
jgi:hypothetical protein